MLCTSSYLLYATAMIASSSLSGAPPRDAVLVSPAWVRDHLQDRNIVLLHVGPREGYEKAHIPGARYLGYNTFSDRSADGLALELPPLSRLDSAFASLGVSKDSRVILYFGSGWVSPTTRAWLTLEHMGLGSRTSIMDGGLEAWMAAGFPVSRDVPPAGTGTLRTVASPGIVVDAKQVSAGLKQSRFRLIDERDREFYLGLDAGSGTRPGHLPGAKSLPFTSVTDSSGRFLPNAELTRLFAAAGVSPGDELVVYCHIGQQATAVVFAARLIGIKARLYDGSYQDWTRNEQNAVEGAVPATRGGLISTDALAQRLTAREVTLIDLRSDLNQYLADHLPGAVYLHYETLRASSRGVPADVLSGENYAAIWSRLGIRRDRPVVVYSSGDAQDFNATFLTWLLSGFRHPEVYVLDGGYGKWKAEGRPLDRSYPEIAAVQYAVEPYMLEQIAGEHIHHMLGQKDIVIVDVRPADQFNGTAGAQVRRGRIPGAVNRFWHDNLVTVNGVTQWKPVEVLRKEYAEKGITPDRTVIVYCNTGTEASHAYFALKHLLGYPKVLVYVPSWTEWSEKSEWPVESGVAATANGTAPAAAAGGRSCSDQ